jgi:hypothetical protein
VRTTLQPLTGTLARSPVFFASLLKLRAWEWRNFAAPQARNGLRPQLEICASTGAQICSARFEGKVNFNLIASSSWNHVEFAMEVSHE